MRTVDEILMRATPEQVFRAAMNVEQWPAILRHYRWVKVHGYSTSGRVVEMAVRHGGIPLWWRAEQRLDIDQQQVCYTHTDGMTRGMEVVWQLAADGDGTRVRIIHELTFLTPIVHGWPGQVIAGWLFIKPVAQRTLRGLKRHLEEAICHEPS